MRPETVWLLTFFLISENRLNGFENSKTQLFNSGGVVKWAYFQKKVDYPFNVLSKMLFSCLGSKGAGFQGSKRAVLVDFYCFLKDTELYYNISEW